MSVAPVAPRRSATWAREALGSRWGRVRRIELLGVPVWVFAVRADGGSDLAWLGCDAVLGLVTRLPARPERALRGEAVRMPLLRGPIGEDEARAAVRGALRHLALDGALREQRSLRSWEITSEGCHAWPFWVAYRRGLFGWSLRAAEAVRGTVADAGWRRVLTQGLVAGLAEHEASSSVGWP